MTADRFGRLHVVATPIGNLDDLSPRAAQVLRDVPHVAAEDTRHSRPLLTRIGSSAAMLSLHDHNEEARISQLLKWLHNGEDVALISDAGTPLISDPGYRLVAAVRAAGVEVLAIPGPCAAVAALSIAGLPTDCFAFDGFLPAKKAARVTRLQELKAVGGTWVIYESGRRLRACISDMQSQWPADTRLFVGRELTKQFEESFVDHLGRIGEWLDESNDRLRGEFVLVAHLPQQAAAARREIDVDRLLNVLAAEVPASAAARIAAQLFDLPRRELYARLLDESGDDSDDEVG